MSNNAFVKKIINLKASLDFHQNSIVSQTVLNKGNQSITLFAFDEGQDIATHSAPIDALVQVIEGNVEVIISGESFNLQEGDFIIMPKDEPHSLKALSKFKMMLVKF